MNSNVYCRICVKHNTNVKLTALIESIVPKSVAVVNSVFELWKIFIKILNVFDATEKHNLQICEVCAEEIQQVYKFIEKCETNGNVWRRMQIKSLTLGHQTMTIINDQDLSKTQCSDENKLKQSSNSTNSFVQTHEQVLDVSATTQIEASSDDCSDSEKLNSSKLEDTVVVDSVMKNELSLDDSSRFSIEDDRESSFNTTVESSSRERQDEFHCCGICKELYFDGTSSMDRNMDPEDFERVKESESSGKIFGVTKKFVCENCKKEKEQIRFLCYDSAYVSPITFKQSKNDEDSLLTPISNANSSDDSTNINQKRRVRVKPYIRYTTAQKELLIKCYEGGMSIKKAASLAKLNYHSASSILRMYKRNDCQLIEKPCGGNRRKKLTEDVLGKIEIYVENNPGITLNGIKHELAQENIDVGKTTIVSALRMLRVTLKILPIEPQAIGDKEAIVFRQVYAQHVSKKCEENLPSIIFIGVCGYNIHFRHKQPRQDLLDISGLPIVRGRDITSIVAITNSDVVHSSILHQPVCSSEKMCTFVQEMILQLGPLRTQKLIVMDNPVVYDTNDIKNVVAVSGFELLFVPPCSSSLNPARDVFAKVKLYLRNSLDDENTQDCSIEELTRQGILSITSSDCEKCVESMIKRLHVILNRQESD